MPHSLSVKDSYWWKQDKNSAEINTFIEEENELFNKHCYFNRELQKQIASEIISRLDMSRTTPSSKNEQYEYYVRDIEGKSKPIYCRRKDDVEEIIFDENSELDKLVVTDKSVDLQSVSVRCLGTSPDQHYWMIAVDWLGNERYQLFIKDLITGCFIHESIKDAAAEIAWLDNNSFIFLFLDDRNRPYQARQYEVNTLVQEHPTLFEEQDQRFFLSIERSASGRYIFLTIVQLQECTEVHILSTNVSELFFTCFAKRRKGNRYSLTHHDDYFYIVSNQDGINKSLCRIGVNNFQTDTRECIYPCQSSIELFRLQAFKNYLVLYQRCKQVTQIRVIDPVTLNDHYIELPDKNYVISYADNFEYDTDILTFYYSSLTIPDTLYSYNMQTRKLCTIEQIPVENYNADDYQSEYVHVQTADGEIVPISLVYKKSLKCMEGNPLLLYGYGAYGYSLPAEFTSLRVSLLDRGFIYAIAHVRGGGELGPDWHLQGKQSNKRNSFSDFIACADYLKKYKYTTTSKMAVMGESAGGLLVTAAVNQQIDLCKVLVAINPFVDVFNTLSDPELPGTTEEWIEWGNPANEDSKEYILSYSPYENIRAMNYPDMLLVCSLNDAQVPYWEACKYALRVRKYSTNDAQILLKIHQDSGHQGTEDRYDYIDQEAELYSYLINRLCD